MPSPIVDTLQPFFWGRGGARLTPEQIAREREIAEALLKNGIDFSPVGHWLQGAARLANAIAGKVTEGRAKKAEGENARISSEVLQRLLESSGGTAFATPALTGAAPTSAPLDPISGRVAQAHDAVQISGNKQEFVNALLPYAIEESKRTGIDPRIIVAQAALETGWGRSAPGNNYFGIKSHGQGGGQTLATTEVINGRPVRVRDSFRAYASPADSVRGYGDFILQNPRYKALREAQGLDAQLEALGASGYATDPNYARKVGAIARGITIPDMALPDMATAYAPTGSPLPGALAAAPFPSAGLPTVPADAAPASDVIVATTPEEILAAEEAMNSPEFVLPGQTAAPDGGRLVNPLDLPENQITLNYVDEHGNPLPDQGDGGDPVVRQAPADASIWGGGMDPNDPSTIPAIAGGTRDVTAAPTGYFPPAPAPVGAAPAPAAAPSGPAINPAIIEALTSPYVDDNTKRIATLLLQQQLTPREPQPLINAGDGRLFDPNTGQWIIAPGADQPKMPDSFLALQLRAQAAGLQPGTPEFNEFMLSGGREPMVNVNVGPTETEYDKVIGKQYGERFVALQDDAAKAQSALGTLDSMEQAINDPNFYSGAAGETVLQLRRVAASLGFSDPEKITSMEQFNAQAKQAALDAMGGSLGTGFSNADRDFVVEQVPNLGNTPEGNRRLIEVQRRINERKLQIAQLARDYVARNGRLGPGFDEELAKWAEANPLFPRDTQGGPRVGEIVDGYRFKGGDPADPNSWEKVN